MSSFWWKFHHWLHRKLSFWQLSVQPVMKISSKWWHFRFSELNHINVILQWKRRRKWCDQPRHRLLGCYWGYHSPDQYEGLFWSGISQSGGPLHQHWWMSSRWDWPLEVERAICSVILFQLREYAMLLSTCLHFTSNHWPARMLMIISYDAGTFPEEDFNYLCYISMEER